MTLFDSIPTSLRQSFTIIRRSSGLVGDSYGDATFSEVRNSGYRGWFQSGARPGQVLYLGGKEVSYDGVVYTKSTAMVAEGDIILFGSSTATTVSTRYHVQGIAQSYDGAVIDHKEIYVQQEVL